MNLELYLAFVAASMVLIAFPGPNVALIVANSLNHGSRAALLTVAGTNTAQAVQLAVTVAGMTSLVALLAESFEILRWLGVTYLAFLGLRTLFAKPKNADDDCLAETTGRGRAMYWQGLVVALTNPKTLFFFAAFFPQFIDPALPPLGQSLALAATYLAIATILDGGYALAGARLRPMLRSLRAQRIRNRITGSLLLTAAAGLALARRSN